VRYELNDRQETRRTTFSQLFIALEVDTVQCFGPIQRLDEERNRRDFFKKLKFWKIAQSYKEGFSSWSVKM
jgi:hypothetical protein